MPNAVKATRVETRHIPVGLVILLILAALILLAGLVAGALYLYFLSAGPVVPGINVDGTAVGGLSLEQAAEAIDADWNRGRVLLVTDGAQYFETAPLDFGLWVDPAASAYQAYLYGRGDQRWSQLFAMLSGDPAPEFLPVVVFGPQVAAEQLTRWAAIVARAPGDPTLVYEDGHWRAVPGQPGSALDYEASLKNLADNYELVMRSGVLPLLSQPVESDPAVLNSTIAALEEELNKPLLLTAYDPITDSSHNWTVPREVLAGWVRPNIQDGSTALMPLDESSFPAYLQALAASEGGTLELEPPAAPYKLTEHWQSGEPVEITLRHTPTAYTVQPGDTLLKIGYNNNMPFWMILEANPGLSSDNITSGQTITIPSLNDLLPLPVVRGKRIVMSISQQRMRIYEAGAQIREFVISTGIDRSPTQPGVFQVRTHELSAYASVWDLTMPHFLGIYEAWPGFMNGIHGLPTLSSGQILWANVLGKPASYGCIILSLENATWLYDWAENGVVVQIDP